MRKLIVLSLVTLFCLPLAVYAASIGGAETQGKGKFGIGLDQEFVFDRDMKFDKANGVLDNLDIYVKLGTADFEMADVWTETGEEWHDTDKGKNAFAYGFGAKGTYELKDGWLVGVDLQYLRHKNKYTGRGYDALDPTDTESWYGTMTFQEWQIAPYIAKKIGNFVPYLGVKYSDLRIKDKNIEDDGGDEDTIKWKADDNVGVFLGTDYKIADNWKLNLEGRFVDETAISLGATYKF